MILNAKAKSALGKELRHLRSKEPRYWFIALLLIPLGMLIGESLSDWTIWVTARNAIYKVLQDISPHSPKHSKRTVMVLIGDEEYWKGELARRTPLKREYLAKLLYKLDLANPAAIGLDVDLRSQDSGHQRHHHADYYKEDQDLLYAIRSVSSKRCLVLARTLERQPSGKMTPEPAIFDPLKDLADFREGYASLPHDIRRVPLVINLATGIKLQSFSAALASCVDKESVIEAQQHKEDALPFWDIYKG